MYLNKAFIIGNLTRDPEVRALPSGTKVTSFSLATNRVYKDKDGARQESVDYHNIVTFARLAELCGQYLKKGSQAYVEGRIQTRSWDAPDGTKKYRTEIIAETVQFGQRGNGGGDSGAASSGKKEKAVTGKAGDAPKDAPNETIEYPQDDINPDDIPF